MYVVQKNGLFITIAVDKAARPLFFPQHQLSHVDTAKSAAEVREYLSLAMFAVSTARGEKPVDNKVALDIVMHYCQKGNIIPLETVKQVCYAKTVEDALDCVEHNIMSAISEFVRYYRPCEQLQLA